MSLEIRYDVLPHSVSREEVTDYANFKMIVSFKRASGATAINIDLWKEITAKINSTFWKWEKVEWNKPDGRQLRFIPTNDLEDSNVVFRLRSYKNELKKSPKFHFSSEFITKSEFYSSFPELILKDENENPRPNLYWPSQGDRTLQSDNDANVGQFEFTSIRDISTTSTRQVSPEPEMIGVGFNEILEQADSYAKRQENLKFSRKEEELNFNSAQSPRMSLEAIYATLLDEPAVAEIRFGLVREFRIKITELIQNEGEYLYAIDVPDKPASDKTKMNFLLKKLNNKYYNGISKLVLAADQDFNSVTVNFSDPYNNYLNSVEDQNISHPDGIYMIVKYGQEGSQIKDPFENPVIKGFNVAVRTSYDGKYYSLSQHEKKVELLAYKRRHERAIHIPSTSGLLSPQADLMLTDNNKVRNNLLFTWRGDNLLVNRIVDEMSTDGSYGNLETIEDDYNEGEFANTHLFKRRENLIDSSQTQLVHFDGEGTDYIFYVRTVSPTGHYLPLKNEILDDPDQEILLTLEDFVIESNRRLIRLKEVKFDFQKVEKVPIKALSIIGDKEYKNSGSDFVDNKQHLVLNAIEEETEEVRFLYPPMVKFEDFRYQSYLTIEKLSRSSNIPIGAFKRRAVRYEKKAKKRLTKIAATRTDIIDYLADVRGEHVLFTPNDLFTANAIKKTKVVTDSYKYYDSHPYYRSDTRSCKLELVESQEKYVVRLLTNSGAVETVFQDLTQAIYNFELFVLDTETISHDRLRYYNGQKVKMSILDRPPAPSINPVMRTSVIRKNNDAQRNFWFANFTVERDSVLWKSLKYLDLTTSLRLIHEKKELDNLARRHFGGPRPLNLLNDEYPYEMFLETNSKDNLQTSLYPEVVNVEFKIGAHNLNEKNYFKLPLNEGESIIAQFNAESDLDILINDEKKDVVMKNTAASLKIRFDANESMAYKIWLIIGENEKELYEMKSIISPELSVHDVITSDKVIDAINFLPKDYKLNVTRSKNFRWIVDENNPFSSLKELELFGSSIFQAYFPNEEKELNIGTKGDKLTLTIPNNTRPQIPSIEGDVLLVKKQDSSWSQGSKNIKENHVESILRVQLDQNFMKEGANFLGIILKRITQTKNDEPSQIGEDITKLSRINWTGYDLGSIINESYADPNSKYYLPFIGKYFSKNDIKQYEVDGITYKVLKCKPYYNTQIKKWQVLIPFKLQLSETMFIKLAAIKIAPGHSTIVEDGVIKDPTKTTLSGVSEPVQIPIYNQKRIIIERKATGIKGSYIITNKELSEYESKTYCIMVKKKNEPSVLNLQGAAEKDNLKSFVSFGYGKMLENYKTGKVLQLNQFERLSIDITDDASESILVCEFEIHENSEWKKKEYQRRIDLPDDLDYGGIQLPDDWEWPRTSPHIPRPGIPRFELTKKWQEKRNLTQLENSLKNEGETLTTAEFLSTGVNPFFDIKGIRLLNITEIKL